MINFHRQTNKNKNMSVLKKLFILSAIVLVLVGNGCRPKAKGSPAVSWDNLGEVEYVRYHNPRFGFFLEYPSFMTKDASPENGDGISCRCEGLEISAYGSLNIDPTTGKMLSIEGIAKYYALPTDTACSIDSNIIVMKGVTGNGNIHFQKFINRDGLTFSFEATYDSKDSDYIEPVVNHMAESFDCSQPGEEG